MNFQIPDELERKIEQTFKKNPELKAKLLSLDPDAISSLCMLPYGINPIDYIEAYEDAEKGENDSMDYLYKLSLGMVAKREIYDKLNELYIQKRLGKIDDSESKSKSKRGEDERY